MVNHTDDGDLLKEAIFLEVSMQTHLQPRPNFRLRLWLKQMCALAFNGEISEEEAHRVMELLEGQTCQGFWPCMILMIMSRCQYSQLCFVWVEIAASLHKQFTQS
ncbi:docking protein 2 [Corchorus olitorius]|uniref:Docking protein 2 n=1 Tax=Corchorus olitorius TaxID=93759 RepID=A0A1R3HAY9_9ROSI|nr:docking protein 2 [Corchorus olitorius]